MGLVVRLLEKGYGPFVLAAVVLAAGLATVPTEAHKPITSKYTYNEHVFPIFRDRCGACHVTGGVAPMSLLTYKDARPWVESIREELVAERMPPHYADNTAGGAIMTTRDRPLTAREIDTIIVWATGGTPEGDPAKRPASIVATQNWPAGRPDLILRMPAASSVAAGRLEDTREFALITGLTATRFVRAADVLPGTPSMVRDATVAIENGPVLAAWVPGDSETPLLGAPAGTAFRLDPGAKVLLRIHYKKSWRDEQTTRSDRTSVGLYFTTAPPPGRTIRTLSVEPAGRTIADPLQVLAIRPLLDRPYRSVDVQARTPAGVRVPLLRLRAPRPEWPRRYWLRRPLDLPSGSRIEITAVPALAEPDRPAPQIPGGRLAVSLDTVPQ